NVVRAVRRLALDAGSSIRVRLFDREDRPPHRASTTHEDLVEQRANPPREGLLVLRRTVLQWKCVRIFAPKWILPLRRGARQRRCSLCRAPQRLLSDLVAPLYEERNHSPEAVDLQPLCPEDRPRGLRRARARGSLRRPDRWQPL